MKNMKRFFKMNNKGASLVTVVICVSFIGILASIIMASSLMNYRMRRVNAYAKDTFYSAEQVLDEINVGLQIYISDSLSEAYMDVMENYNDYDIERKRMILQTSYYEKMWEKLQVDNTHTTYSLAKLETFLKASTKWQGGDQDGYGAILQAVNEDGTTNPTTGRMYTFENGIVLKDLRVSYKDSKGYVSVIQTDIRLTYPGYDFATTTALPEVGDYGVIADNGMVTGIPVGMTLTGNFYADSFESVGGADPAATYAINHTGDGKVIVKHDMRLENVGFTNEQTGVVWAGGIETDGGMLNLKGETLVADDLNINGTGSEVTLAGVYNGFGNSIQNPEASSAILVNGNNSSIDLSGLTQLTVAGHAYVGTQRPNDVNDTDPTDPANAYLPAGDPDAAAADDKNVYTGESVAVKSNQLMYLIPPECLWVDANGYSAIGKNPMTETEYKTLTEELRNDPGKYTEVSLTKNITELGDSLINYMATDLTGVADPHIIYVPANGERLIYYYINFKNEAAANEYFNAYYNTDKATYDRYIKSYLDLLEFPENNNVNNIRLAAHGISGGPDATTGLEAYNIVAANIDNASVQLSDNQTLYSDRFLALCTKLTEDYAELSASGLAFLPSMDDQIVYENLIDTDYLQTYIDEVTGAVWSERAEITPPGGTDTIVLTRGDYTVTNAAVRLVIAGGDVTVQVPNFTGTIIANGKVTLTDGVQSVKTDPVAVNALLRHYVEIDEKNVMVAQVLRDGKDYIFAVEDENDEEDNVTSMADLVIYENWKKE